MDLILEVDLSHRSEGEESRGDDVGSALVRSVSHKEFLFLVVYLDTNWIFWTPFKTEIP